MRSVQAGSHVLALLTAQIQVKNLLLWEHRMGLFTEWMSVLDAQTL
jgi:hypothetical protein